MSLTCPECSAKCNLGSKFCKSCGASVVVSSNCLNCLALLDADAKFCGDCGTKRAAGNEGTSRATHGQQQQVPTATVVEYAQDVPPTSTQSIALPSWREVRKGSVTADQQANGTSLHESVPVIPASVPATKTTQTGSLPTYQLPKGARGASQPYRILVIGQTGSGKSTMINVMCNFLRGGSVKNLKVLISTKYLKPTEKDAVGTAEANPTDTSVAQTTECICYKFVHANGSHFELIDSPGLADTKGVKQDAANVANILTFCSKLDYLDFILIVVNGTTSRFDICMKSMLQRFRGNLPNSVLKSVAVAFTNCMKTSCNFNIQVLESNLMPQGQRIEPKNIFYFQNNFFTTNPKSWTQQEVDEELLPCWEKAMRSMNDLLSQVTQGHPMPTKDFAVMRETRDMLKSKMADVMGEIHNLDQVRQKIEQAKILQSRANADKDLYKNFIVQEEVDRWETVDTISHNTNCTVHQITCHEHCGLQEIKTAGDPAFGNCACFQGGSGACTLCIRASPEVSCPPANHYHDNKKWIHRKETVERTLDDMKAKHEDCVQQEAAHGKALSQAEQDLNTLEEILDNLMVDIQTLCVKLREIASGFNLAAELDCIVQLWEYELVTITDLHVQQDLRKRISHITNVIQNLSGKSVFIAPGTARAPTAAATSGRSGPLHI